jgi:tripartite-type tricarboxylate transporter receptor subunit TctC
MRRISAVLLVLAAPPVAPATAQESLESFYRGKTISFVIGSNVGGGYDAYARLVGRHIGKYIPGRPQVVPSNMAGAGGNTAANHVYNIAPRDGTVVAAASPGALLDPLIGDRSNLRHDPLKLQYIGSATGEVFTCIVRKDAVANFAEAFTKEVIIGVSGGTTHDMPRALVNVLGVKYRIVAGYPGTREIAFAMDKGEVQGLCGQGIANISWQRPDWFTPDAPVRVIVQESISGDPELKKQGVPLALDFAKTPEQRRILEIVYSQGIFTRPYFMAPDVPKDRVEAIRKAFLQALADPELLTEAAKQQLQVNPLPGEDLEKMIRDLYATPPDIVEKVRRAIAAQ